MPKKISRRTFIRRTFGSIFAMTAASAGGYYYAKEIETRLLEINKYEIYHPNIPIEFDQFKMVQFSDTHLGFHYHLDQLAKIVNKINKLNPDVVFFTGDLMDEPNKYKNSEEIIPILSNIQTRFGKFSIYGNHDHGGYGTDLYHDIMINSGFTLLQNNSQEIQLLNGSSIYIVGLDDAMLGKPDLKEAVSGIPEESYKVLLAHEPDLATAAVPFGIQLQISGHSHGGQVKIPFIGPLITPPYSERYYEGFYELKDVQNALTLYVNRGIGTTRLPFRFLSKPELTLFTLSAGKH
ncbi:metallophosphoesterase [Niallia sp. Krafla_26]|uniref:metallophosphoesterase n=1 Tax=Niallia sp. Krafla_26 TaxID=3064703 RepID=UPI003D16615B